MGKMKEIQIMTVINMAKRHGNDNRFMNKTI